MRGLFAGVLFAIAMVVGLYFWQQPSPETPRDLFNIRCAACHELPDLSGYTARERRGIVMTMLTERGAGEVISAQEAGKIIEYLSAAGTSISQEDQGNGET